ncbi:MAG: alpha/beta hydrolase [Pseudomonadota bacterium]
MIQPSLIKPPEHWERLSQQAPALAGDLAFRRFCTPVLSEARAPDHDALTLRARRHLRHAKQIQLKTCEGLVQAYILEPLCRNFNGSSISPSGASIHEGERTKTVILVHGWTSEASFMAAIAEQVRRSGFRVILFDMPAHGLSPGTHTNMIACARVFIDVVDQLGPIDYAVAHSMGGLAALLAAGGGAPYQRACALDGYVLIATPNNINVMTDKFAKGLRLTQAARRQYERHLERIAHNPLSKLCVAGYLNAIQRPVMILHCRDDEEITIDNARKIVRQYPAAELREVNGLGHRHILYASNVTRASTRFLVDLDKQLAAPRRTKSAVPIRPDNSFADSSEEAMRATG